MHLPQPSSEQVGSHQLQSTPLHLEDSQPFVRLEKGQKRFRQDETIRPNSHDVSPLGKTSEFSKTDPLGGCAPFSRRWVFGCFLCAPRAFALALAGGEGRRPGRAQTWSLASPGHSGTNTLSVSRLLELSLRPGAVRNERAG